VRIVHGDANPAGPGLKFEDVGTAFAGTYPSRFQPAHSGSYGIVTAVCGSCWTGEETAWRHRPRHYAAIRFHEDDLYDCGWYTDFEVTIPEGMASGVYGVRLRGGGEQDIVPFYVLPPAGVVTAPLVFVASTSTYQIYGNHQRGNVDDTFRQRQAEWGAYKWNAQDHPE
jgi:N,N-dimethylformamidase